MKKAFLLLSIIVLLLLAACTNADVYYSLGDGEFGAEYSLEIASSDLAARTYSDQINEYWQQLGFDSQADINGDTITITGTRHDTFDDMSYAADSFYAFLTSDESLFSEVTFDYTPSFEYDEFCFEATISLEDVIRQYELQDIPENDISSLLESADEGKYTLSLSLPGDVVETNADETSGQVCTWNLTYGQVRQIVLETSMENTEEIESYNELKEKQQTTGMLLKILIVVAGFLLLLMAVLLIVRSVRKRSR